MATIPKTFTVTIGGKTLRFRYFEETSMRGRPYCGYTLDDESQDADLGFDFKYTNRAVFSVHMMCYHGQRDTWVNKHIRQGDAYFDFPTLESAIFGFKEYLRKNYVSKRASPRKKINAM